MTSLKFLPTDVEHVPIVALRPYARNARQHSEHQVALIAASLVEHGWTQPILVDADGGIVAGHGRLEAARKLGLSAVPVIRVSHLSPAQVRALRLADNRLAELAAWDEELLAGELHALNGEGMDLSAIGFDEAELDRLMAPLDDTAPVSSDADANEDGANAADEVPEPAQETVTRPGDLWLMGEHRLLCGDSTDAACIARVMGGERAALLFTSPPYAQQRDYTKTIDDWDALVRGVFRHLDTAMRKDGQVLVNLGLIHRNNEWQPYWQGWIESMRTQGWRRFGWYVWDKTESLPGDWNGRLAPSFEFIFHLNKQARKPNKFIRCGHAGHINDTHGGMRSKDGTVGKWSHAGLPVQDFRIPDATLRIVRHKTRGIECEHPAVFPWRLPAFVMEAYSDRGDVVFEPFAGSGTSIIAGEKVSRRVRALEVADRYIDLAVRRWNQLFADKPATLDGKTFEEVAAARGVELQDAA